MPGELPWIAETDHSSIGGATADDACQSIASLSGYTVWGLPSGGEGACIVSSSAEGDHWEISVTRFCEESDDSISCTVESPCHMELTADQWQTIDDYVGIFLTVALVVAAFMGYRAGNIR